MAGDAFQTGYDAGAARAGRAVVQTPPLGTYDKTSNYHLQFANGASLGFARGCLDREENERRVQDQLG
ncbi:hypothetical protein N9K16_03960 [Alphaproteobacteria bacterium]|nr:hypothetical protein [Alphaproteobacteria bacterium]